MRMGNKFVGAAFARMRSSRTRWSWMLCYQHRPRQGPRVNFVRLRERVFDRRIRDGFADCLPTARLHSDIGSRVSSVLL